MKNEQNEQDDSRLTAYALGELSGEEKAALEAELARSENARHELEAIEVTLRVLREELSLGPLLELSRLRKKQIEAALDERSEEAEVVPLDEKRKRRRWLFWGLGSVGAAAAAAVLFSSSAESPQFAGTSGSAAWGRDDSVGVKGEMSEGKLRRSDVAEFGMIDLLSSAAPGFGEALQIEKGRKHKGKGRFNREGYAKIVDNPFIRVASDPRSTFSIDVDTASYALVRRYLREGRLPPKGAVRIEEMVNYFSYSYPEPKGGQPFSVTTDVASAPWSPEHRLLRIGLKGKHIEPENVPGSNLVFLLDVSGSMSEPNKLPLLKQAFSMLVNQLDESDRVSIVVYAGSAGLVLPSTAGNQKGVLLGALDRLEAGGSTAGGDGIELAYKVAGENFVEGGINRVILATDGDFNVGTSSESELVNLIQKKAKSGVFLSVLGLGGGNFNDSMLEKIANKGNGNYAYLDTPAEARRVLVEQATGTLMTIAKDVKIQVEFNPAKVEAFRLIGYENRLLAHQDFNDDKKDAGEIGADHTVTALYEIVPAGRRVPVATTDALKYQAPRQRTAQANSGETATIKLRYKLPEAKQSQLLEVVVRDRGQGAESASSDFRFAMAVAELGMLLRESPFKGKQASYDQVIRLAGGGLSNAQRRELVELVTKAWQLKR